MPMFWDDPIDRLPAFGKASDLAAFMRDEHLKQAAVARHCGAVLHEQRNLDMAWLAERAYVDCRRIELAERER